VEKSAFEAGCDLRAIVDPDALTTVMLHAKLNKKWGQR
jgi:hypothetical protein